MGSTGTGINPISYDGIVKITTKDKNGNKKVSWSHNAGTEALGALICKSLIRGKTGVVGDDLKPFKVNFIARGEKGVGTSLISNTVQIESAVTGNADSLPAHLKIAFPSVIGFVKFSATIESDSVLIVSDPPSLQLVMQDKHGTTLAYIEDSYGDSTLLDAYLALKNQEVNIDWYMLIINSNIGEL